MNDEAFIQALSSAVFASGGSKQIFAEWDSNGNRTLTADELHAGMKSVDLSVRD